MRKKDEKKNKTSFHFKIHFRYRKFSYFVNAFKYSRKTYCYLAAQRLSTLINGVTYKELMKSFAFWTVFIQLG